MSWKQLIAAVTAAGAIFALVQGWAWVEDRHDQRVFASEFKALQFSLTEEKLLNQIADIEKRQKKSKCARPGRDERHCGYLDGRLRFWQTELGRLRGKR